MMPAGMVACPACGTDCQRLDPRTKWPAFVTEHMVALGEWVSPAVLRTPYAGVLAHALMVHNDEELVLVLASSG